MLDSDPVPLRLHEAAVVIALALVAGGVLGCAPGPVDSSVASGRSELPGGSLVPAGSLRPTGSAGSARASPSASKSPPPSTKEPGDIFAVMAEVVASQRPNVRFELTPDTFDGNWVLDGNGTDGFGPGRLYIVATDEAGTITTHPCSDRDFHQGGPCVERIQENGNVLVLRDVVQAQGTRVIEVVVIHPDRSGISLEATNFSITPPSGPLPAGQPRPGVTITRRDPLYTLDELAELALALDARLRTCQNGVC